MPCVPLSSDTALLTIWGLPTKSFGHVLCVSHLHSSSLIPFVHLKLDPYPRSNVTFQKPFSRLLSLRINPVWTLDSCWTNLLHQWFFPWFDLGVRHHSPILLGILGIFSFDRIMFGILAFLPDCNPVLHSDHYITPFLYRLARFLQFES